jgi:NAD(P)-dependent dehydrogenase (short-subunit alcohol dehydrogenase family)
MNATVLAALITGAAGLIGGALAVYFTQRRHNETREDEAQRREAEARSQAEEAHRRAAVAYLKIIEETIEGMRDQLAESQIPYRLGHQFSGLLGSYKDFLQPYLGDETQYELDKLKRRVQEVVANEYDPALRSELEVESERLSEILSDMERVEGDVWAQATRISPTESRVN